MGMDQQASAGRELDRSAYRARLVTACLQLAVVERRELDAEPYIESVDRAAVKLARAMED